MLAIFIMYSTHADKQHATTTYNLFLFRSKIYNFARTFAASFCTSSKYSSLPCSMAVVNVLLISSNFPFTSIAKYECVMLVLFIACYYSTEFVHATQVKMHYTL